MTADFTSFPHGRFPPSIEVSWTDVYVNGILVRWKQVPSFTSADGLASRLGEPDSLEIVLTGGEAGSFYNILFVYQGSGLVAVISGFGTFTSNGTQEVCLTKSEDVTSSTLLYPIGHSMKDLFEYYGFLSGEPFLQWSDATGLTDQEILDRLIDRHGCVPYFSVPQSQ
jgi:hypothetical protein